MQHVIDELLENEKMVYFALGKATTILKTSQSRHLWRAFYNSLRTFCYMLNLRLHESIKLAHQYATSLLKASQSLWPVAAPRCVEGTLHAQPFCLESQSYTI